MNLMAQRFAKRIWLIGAFRDRTQSPEGKGFRFKLHEKQPEAPLSPFYIDLRLLQSDFEAKGYAVEILANMLHDNLSRLPDRLGAIPEAIVAVVSTLSDETAIPMITPRQPKGHGSGAKIDGIWSEGQTVVLFDDVITGADSKLAAARAVRDAKLVVNDVMVLVDREQGGRGLLLEGHLNLHAATTVSELLDYYRSERLMSEDVYAEILNYRHAAG